MDEPAGKDYSQRLGRKWWYLERKAAEIYGCPTCKEGFEKLYNVKHNTVNLHLGKPVVNSKTYEQGIELVMDAFKKYLETKPHQHHGGTHMVHSDELKGVKVSH